MFFNSFVFIGFFIVALAVFHCLGSVKRQNVFLTVASYVFYGWWDWRILSLLLASTVTVFLSSIKMASSSHPVKRKTWLALSLIVNLGILGLFKYFNFFVDSIAEFIQLFGFMPNPLSLRVILPIGISFYTFQMLSYTIDVYKQAITPETDFITFALFISYFPKLVAGPIERAAELIPQFKCHKRITAWHIRRALAFILLGYFLKLGVADFLAQAVESKFSHPEAYHSGSLLSAVYLFAFQIFGDFAGYSAIARGVSLLFGIQLMVNFRQPYFSSNITDFWRRWHISLSTWLRDYLYIFWLGGNKRGEMRTYFNLIGTMLLGGMWHGANWTFLIWGGLHGLALSIHRFTLLVRKKEWGATSIGFLTVGSRIRSVIGVLVTFNFVCLGWIFFRAPSVSAAWAYLIRILRADNILRIMPEVVLAGFLLCFAEIISISIDGRNSGDDRWMGALFRWPALAQAVVFAALVIGIVLFRPMVRVPFVYSQF